MRCLLRPSCLLAIAFALSPGLAWSAAGDPPAVPPLPAPSQINTAGPPDKVPPLPEDKRKSPVTRTRPAPSKVPPLVTPTRRGPAPVAARPAAIPAAPPPVTAVKGVAPRPVAPAAAPRPVAPVAAKPGRPPGPTRSHGGQFVLNLGAGEIPYLFNQTTDFNPNGTRLGWVPMLGLGWGSGQSEYLIKFGAGLNGYASDTAFMFGFEQRRYFGSGVIKGYVLWGANFGTGSKVTLYQTFNLAIGFQVDPSRRYGFYVAAGPGFVTTWGGDAPTQEASNNDASFTLTAHFGVQIRL